MEASRYMTSFRIYCKEYDLHVAERGRSYPDGIAADVGLDLHAYGLPQETPSVIVVLLRDPLRYSPIGTGDGALVSR